MTNSQRLATVRQAFLHWLRDAGVNACSDSHDNSLIQRESVLIRDEFFCGRRFIAKDHHAVWFIEEDVVKIHLSDGQLMHVLRGAEIDEFAVRETVESSPSEASNIIPTPVVDSPAPQLGPSLEEQVSSLEEQVSSEAVARVPQTVSEQSEDPTLRIFKLPAPSDDSVEQSGATANDSSVDPQSGESEFRKAA